MLIGGNLMHLSECKWNELLLVWNINCAVCQKCYLPLIQVNVHQLIGGLCQKCPCDQILSARNCNLRKCFKIISSWKVLFFKIRFNNQSLFLVFLFRHFQILDLFTQVINWFFKSLSITYLSCFLNVKSFLNWP